LWEPAAGKEPLVLKVDDQSPMPTDGFFPLLTSIYYSVDGGRIAIAGSQLGGVVKVWETRKGQGPLTLEGHSGVVSAVAFSLDSSWLATGSGDRTVRIWDARNGRQKGILKGHSDSIVAVAFSPDGRRIASVSTDEKLKLWDTDSGQEVVSLNLPVPNMGGVAFSPDGNRIGVTSQGGTVRVWDATPRGKARRVEAATSDAPNELSP
jgi:WD40 repeat protein